MGVDRHVRPTGLDRTRRLEDPFSAIRGEVRGFAWRAALDIASLVPLADVDTFGGTIVTEWYSLADRPDERIKLTIFVVGRELRSDSISVRVHVQKRMTDGWGEAVRDQALAGQIEDLILARARELRAESLAEVAD